MPADNQRPVSSRAPRRGLQMMGLILIAMILLALYANFQKARLKQIETVTISPAPPLPSPTVSLPPEEP